MCGFCLYVWGVCVCVWCVTLVLLEALLFINLFLFLAALGLRCCTRLSLDAASGGYSSLQCADLWQWLFLLWSTGSRHVGFSNCGTRALERRLSSCGARA